MTTPYKYFKLVSDRVLIERHERKGMIGFSRVCQKCDAVQPDSCHVNQVCASCGNPVVLWQPLDKEKE